jgi:hypothetical protein
VVALTIAAMRSVPTATLALTLLAWAGAASPAQADFAPSATAKLVDEGLSPDGRRTVRIEVSGSCGPSAGPNTEISVMGTIKGHWARDTHAPYDPDARQAEDLGAADWVPGSSSSFRFRLSGGLVASAVGSVQCHDPDSDDTRTADSPLTPALATPVRLLGAQPNAASYSYRRTGCPTPFRKMQVGGGYDLSWRLDLDPRGLLGIRKLGAKSLKSVRLHIAGGGARSLAFSPSVAGYRHFGGLLLNGFYYEPRKPKPVRLWATIGGLDSNVITMKVKPRPRGC